MQTPTDIARNWTSKEIQFLSASTTHINFYMELIRYVATQYILLVFGAMTSVQDNDCLILVFVLTHEDDKFDKVVNCSICDKVEITHF